MRCCTRGELLSVARLCQHVCINRWLVYVHEPVFVSVGSGLLLLSYLSVTRDSCHTTQLLPDGRKGRFYSCIVWHSHVLQSD
jgi:hypothetical protein